MNKNIWSSSDVGHQHCQRSEFFGGFFQSKDCGHIFHSTVQKIPVSDDDCADFESITPHNESCWADKDLVKLEDLGNWTGTVYRVEEGLIITYLLV